MATLAADTPVKLASYGPPKIGKFKATAAIFDGAVVVADGSVVDGVKHYSTGTAGGKGIALQPAIAAGEYIEILEDGYIVTPIASTVAAADEGTAVYQTASSTNPADITKTSTSNLPIGTIAAVLVAGGAGSNSVIVHVQGDGHKSR